MRPRPEREETPPHAPQPAFVARQPPLRHERVRLVEHAPVALHDPRIDADDGARGHDAAAEAGRLVGGAFQQHPDGRVQAHGFADGGGEVGERGGVGVARGRVGEQVDEDGAQVGRGGVAAGGDVAEGVGGDVAGREEGRVGAGVGEEAGEEGVRAGEGGARGGFVFVCVFWGGAVRGRGDLGGGERDHVVLRGAGGAEEPVRDGGVAQEEAVRPGDLAELGEGGGHE